MSYMMSVKLRRRFQLRPVLIAVAIRSGIVDGWTFASGADAPTGNPKPPASETNAAVTLPTVLVTGDLNVARELIAPSLGAVSYTIGPSQIQTLSQGENTPFQQVLLQAPGVVQDEFGEVHIRGDHGDLQYRVNGVLLPESLNGFAQEVDTHLIQSVTLMTGTMPAQFGFRTAGVIDVTTKTGSQLEGNEFSMYGGSYDTAHPSVQLGGASTHFDYFVTLSYLRDDLGIDNTTSSGAPLHDRTDQLRAFGYFSYRLDTTSRITLLLSAAGGDFQIPNTPGIAPQYVSVGGPRPDSTAVDEHQKEQNYYAVLSYQKSTDKLSIQLSGFVRETGIHFTPDAAQDLLFGGIAAGVRNSDLANGLQADGSYELTDHHTFRGGLLANYDTERLSTSAQVFPAAAPFAPAPSSLDLPGATPQSGFDPMPVNARSGNEGWTAGFYLQDEWRLTDRLTLNYGARYDLFDVSFDDERQLSPRANLVWQIDDIDTFHAGYARYFMPPTLQYLPYSAAKPFEFTTGAPYNSRDDPQRCERDHYFDLGVSRRILPGWQVTFDSYCKLARNLLDDGQFGNAVILNNFNYTDGTIYGAEVSSTYNKGSWSLYGNFSYVQTWARNIDSAQFEFPNNELAYVSTHWIQLDHQGRFAGSGGVSCLIAKDTKVHSGFLYGNGLRAGFANLQQLPEYWTANLGIERAWRLNARGIKRLKLRVDCLNLFDQVYEIRNGTGIGIAAPAYGPRRAFYAGLSALF